MDEVNKFIEEEHLELYKKTIQSYKKTCRKLKRKNKVLIHKLAFTIEQENQTINKLKKIQYSLDEATIEKIKSDKKLKLLERDYGKLESESNSSIDYLTQQDIKKIYEKHTKSIYIYLEKIK